MSESAKQEKSLEYLRNIEKFVRDVLIETENKQRLARQFLNPSLVDFVRCEDNTKHATQKIEQNIETKLLQTLKKLDSCERLAGKEKVWIMTFEEANKIMNSFNNWDLAKLGIASAQLSFNSGKNIYSQAITDSFGENFEYLEFYRRSDLPAEILEILPPVFSQIQIQKLPDCQDPLISQVENTLDHSRLMIGDVILIPNVVDSKIIFKTIHFVTGNNTKKYCNLRESL